jgi:hypothetical protein
LQDFCPDFEVFEVCLTTGQAADDGVCDVADAGLDWKKVDRESAMIDLVLKKFDEIAGNCSGRLVLGSIGSCLVRL